MTVKRGSRRWHSIATGAATAHVCAGIVAMVAMSMEATPDLLQKAAWIFAVLGLAVFASIFARIAFLRSADLGATAIPDDQDHEDRRSTQRLLAFFGFSSVAMFLIFGTIWVYPAKAQCLIQEWVLGLVVAEGCSP